MAPSAILWLDITLIFSAILTNCVECKKERVLVKEADAIIEQVDGNELDALLSSTNLLAVLFYGKLCGAQCDKVLDRLEHIDDDADNFGVRIVKTMDRQYAKNLGIHRFPSLVYFRHKQPTVYEGDLRNEEKVLEWLTNTSAFENPDEIDEVNALLLEKIVQDTDYVAALFYQDDCKKCEKVLKELENIDDEADNLGISFVKIRDDDLTSEYGFDDLPALVYYRKQIPVLYDGNLMEEEEVLDWLIQQKDTGEDDVIEDVSAKSLENLIDTSSNLAVLFYDNQDEKSRLVLKELENIDDDTDKHGIQFVKIDDDNVAKQFGIDELPAVVYFENEVPNVYEGDLMDEDELLKWLIHQLTSDEIEDVTDEMLDKLIAEKNNIAVLFYDKDQKASQKVLQELENIDDDCDKNGIAFVKIDNDEEAKEYGIDELPTLVYFENTIPAIYDGDLTDEHRVLQWLIAQTRSDEIEDVSDKMLAQLIDKSKYLAVLFYDKDDPKSRKALDELENIDDDCDKIGVNFVKIDDTSAIKEFGIDHLPTLVYFEQQLPSIYTGDLTNEDQVLAWIKHQVSSDEIEDVTDEMLDTLLKNSPSVAVLFYDKGHKPSEKVLAELENIDDECDSHGIQFVKIDNEEETKEYGIDSVPTLVYFEDGIPNIYEGDLTVEEDVLKWLIHQKNEATIEEVTDEILENLIKKHEFVAVFFTGANCKSCDSVLKELENIDDDTDEHGIHFVTTEDMLIAKKYNVKNIPAIALFRNGEPLVFSGNINDEDSVLAWLTDDDTLEIPDKIEEVNTKMLDKVLDTSDNVVVFFYEEGNKKSVQILTKLERIDDDADENDIDFVKISDPGIALKFGLHSLPALVYFRKRFPQIYAGNLEDEEKVLQWILSHKDSPSDIIEFVDRKMLEMLLEEADNLAVYFFEDNCNSCEATLQELENIDDDTDRHGIHFVKTSDIKFAKQLGITTFPSLVYFEDKVPSIYEDKFKKGTGLQWLARINFKKARFHQGNERKGDLTREDDVLDWLVKQKMEDTIENINRDMLQQMIEDKDYLAVFFYSENSDDCDVVLKHLELIDDDLSEYEIELVKMNDNLMAKKYGIRNPPGLVYFRRGKHVQYKGDIEDEEDVLDWLTDPETLELHDHIEKVNEKMFRKMLTKSDYLTVLFYSKDDCRQCDRVLQELENIDDEADSAGIDFVKIDDPALAKKYGVFALPGIVFFRGEADPIIYAGDLKKEERILEWLMEQKNPESDIIEELKGDELKDTIATSERIAVLFYETEECETCNSILAELENIDDDADRHGIKFVKTPDTAIASQFGVNQFPGLIYFEKQVPNIYEGDLSGEEELLQWLIFHRNEDTIETVNKGMLEKLIEDSQYLAVLFFKPNCKACDQVLEELENIDDDTDEYGVQLVRIQDANMAKRYGIKTFPALVYFRNGNPLIFDGDLKNEESVLEWLKDDDNRELADEIEEINSRMLDNLLEESPFLAVFFYDDDCYDCPGILSELENIDDDADLFGINFVKIDDPEAAKAYNIINLPALVYFRKKEPLIYDGDLTDEERVLSWLTSQDVFEIKDEIEEVNRKMLDKLLDENDFVAVFFYDKNCQKCDDALQELEHIDDEADNLDITFVKIRDPRYARKYGINHLPALIYFRRKFPAIYRGDLLAEEEVLDWLQKNRYRHPELNLFMYALAAIATAFVLYTLFLMFCFKKPEHQKTN